MPILQKRNVFVIGAIALIVTVSIRMASPPAVVPANCPDTVFSAQRAHAHLMQIAKEPHSIGTKGHEKVKQYIDSVCVNLGLQTSIQTRTGVSSFRGNPDIFAGRVHNILTRLKGTHKTSSSKSVLIVAHYDSHPNTLGASDDGAGVAAMLEVARILKVSRPLENDIVFLFTDGEEVGLIGARAFIDDSKLKDEVGIVLNFEARGSAGVSHMFEVSNDNGWVMRHFAKSAAHPFANSLNFEVYKLLPNDTDFSLFRRAGFTGLNHAFIERLEDYHSITDSPQKIDQQSLQHHGDNMLSLAKDFGNADLINTRGDDVTYFNLIGSWIIYYPTWLNIVFILLTAFVFVYYIFLSLKKQRTSVMGLLAAFAAFLATLFVMYFSVWTLQKAIYITYPLNNRFHEHNAYNSPWFFLSVTFVSIGIFSLTYQWLSRQLAIHSLYGGAILFAILGMIGLHLFLPTASYLLYFPILFSLIGAIALQHVDFFNSTSWKYEAMCLVFSLPALLLFSPIIHSVFVAFGLGKMMPSIVLLFGLLFGIISPVFESLCRTQRYAVSMVTGIAFVFAMIAAHLNSGFTAKYPLQTNLWYVLNADGGRAHWESTFANTDAFNEPLLAGGEILKDKNGEAIGLIKEARSINLPAPSVLLKQDTILGSGVRELLFHCLSNRNANSMTVQVDTKSRIARITIDEVEVKFNESDNTYKIQYYGLRRDGFSLRIGMNENSPIVITATDRSLGLPEIDGPLKYPENIIPGEGRSSNTTQVKKTFAF